MLAARRRVRGSSARADGSRWPGRARRSSRHLACGGTIADATVTMDERRAPGSAAAAGSGAENTGLLSARAAAVILGVNERTVRRAIARRELPATVHAGVYQITPANLERYRAQRAEPAPAPTLPTPPLPNAVPTRAGLTAAPLPHPLTSLIGRGGEAALI